MSAYCDEINILLVICWQKIPLQMSVLSKMKKLQATLKYTWW